MFRTVILVVLAGLLTLPGKSLVAQAVRTGVVIGDLIHNVAQVSEQEWCPAFDWNQEMARAARRDILGRAVSEGWTVFAGHLEFGKDIGKIAKAEGRFSWHAL